MLNQQVGDTLAQLSKFTHKIEDAKNTIVYVLLGLSLCILIIFMMNYTGIKNLQIRLVGGVYIGAIISIPLLLIYLISNISILLKSISKRSSFIDANELIVLQFMKNTKFGYLPGVAPKQQIIPLGSALFVHWLYLKRMDEHQKKVTNATSLRNSYSNPKPTIEEWRRTNPNKGINEYYAKFG